MADADQALELLIKLGVLGKEDVIATKALLADVATTTTKVGEEAKAAAKSTEQFTEKLSEGTREAEHHALTHRELHKILKMVGGQFGELGHIAHFALNPVLLVTAGLVAGMKAAHEETQLVNEELGFAKDAVSDLNEAWHDVQLKTIEADKSFHKSTEEIKNGTEIRIAFINAEKQAIDSKLESMKREALANAKTDEEKKKVEDQFSSAKKDNELRAQKAEITTKQAEADRLAIERANQMSKFLEIGGGRTPEQIAADLKNIADSKLGEKAAEAAKLAEKTKPGLATDFVDAVGRQVGFVSGVNMPDYRGAAYGQYQSQQGVADALKRAEKAQEEQELRLKQAEKLNANIEELSKRISDLQTDIFKQKGSINISRGILGGPEMFPQFPGRSTFRADVDDARTPFAKEINWDLGQVNAASRIVQGGGSLSKEQSDMIRSIAQVIEGHKMNMKQLTEWLKTHHGDTELEFKKLMEYLEARLQKLK